MQAAGVQDHAIRAGNCGYDAGGKPGVWQERLYSLHRLGRNARFAARLAVGDHIAVEGRLQSRPYQKQLPDGTVQEKIAYEVSVSRLETRAAPEAQEGAR